MKNRGDVYDEEVVAEGGLAQNGAVGDAESEVGPEKRQSAEDAGDEKLARQRGLDVVPVEHQAEVRGGEQVVLTQQVLHGLAPAAHDHQVLHEGERRGSARVEVLRAAVQDPPTQPVQLERFAALAHRVEHRLVRYSSNRGNVETEDGEELVPEPVLDGDERFALGDPGFPGALGNDGAGSEGVFVAQQREKEKSEGVR